MIVGRIAQQPAFAREPEARRQHLPLDDRRVDPVQGVGVAHARAQLGRMVDNDIEAATLQRPPDRLVEHGRIDPAHELVRIVVIVLGGENHVHGLGNSELGGRLDQHRDIGPGRLGRGGLQRLDVRHGFIGIGLGPDRKDMPPWPRYAAEQAGEIAAARNQLEHLVARLDLGEGHELRPMPPRVQRPVGGPRRIGRGRRDRVRRLAGHGRRRQRQPRRQQKDRTLHIASPMLIAV